MYLTTYDSYEFILYLQVRMSDICTLTMECKGHYKQKAQY